MFEFLNVWMFERFKRLNLWMFDFLVFWRFEGFQRFEFLNVWTFEIPFRNLCYVKTCKNEISDAFPKDCYAFKIGRCSGGQKLKDSNIQTFKHFKHFKHSNLQTFKNSIFENFKHSKIQSLRGLAFCLSPPEFPPHPPSTFLIKIIIFPLNYRQSERGGGEGRGGVQTPFGWFRKSQIKKRQLERLELTI